jgi:hypothetical protein
LEANLEKITLVNKQLPIGLVYDKKGTGGTLIGLKIAGTMTRVVLINK